MYGRRTVAMKIKVAVGRDRGQMYPHGPAARPTNRVHVGESTCGVPMNTDASSFNDVQKQAWAQNCGPGEKRRPLGTTRSEVAAAASEVFSFASLVPFKAYWLDIDDQIASDFSITSFQFGLNQLIVGGAINASAFNSRSGKDCTDVFDGCLIYPSIPAQLTVVNNSLEGLFFEATLWGNALITC